MATISTEGLNFTPDKAKWQGKEIVGCTQHPDSQLTTANTDMGVVIICVPKSKQETHILDTVSSS